MTEKELEQFGVISNQVPKEEWIKPKSDKVTLYNFKKEKFKKCILGIVLLFLLIVGISVGILQSRTLSLKELSGAKYDIGKYISGEATVRTKIIKTDFGALNGGNKKWKYFVGIPYGNHRRYVLLLLDENSYKKYEMLPEIDFEQPNLLKNEDGNSVKIEGKVRDLTEIPQNLEYWCDLLGITEEMILDDNGIDSPEKQEQLLEERMSMIVYIEPKDIVQEKCKIIIMESACIFIIMGIILWKKRFSFYETVERI
ncbi:MAG: hypothetical protein K2N51_19630 [Lachnospiraceae bacterium]|nr:hypothetical protein [Lachnospiraceae bacterium]